MTMMNITMLVMTSLESSAMEARTTPGGVCGGMLGGWVASAVGGGVAGVVEAAKRGEKHTNRHTRTNTEGLTLLKLETQAAPMQFP